MSNILVTGSKNGLGKAIADALTSAGHIVLDYDIVDGNDVLKPYHNPDIPSFHFKENGKEVVVNRLDVLINCAGINLIDWLEDINETMWDEVIGVNAKGIMKMSQACLSLLKKSGGTILNIVSNAAHMPMNSSLVYNASKGAAHIMTLQMARELFPRHGIHVFGIAPNKLSGTNMSKSIDEQVVRTRGWTKEYAQEYQLKGLAIGEETPPYAIAEFIAFLLQDKEHHKYLHGCILPYGK